MLAVGRLFRCLMQRISYICRLARHAVTCLAAFQWYHSMGAWGWATRHMQALPAECVACGLPRRARGWRAEPQAAAMRWHHLIPSQSIPSSARVMVSVHFVAWWLQLAASGPAAGGRLLPAGGQAPAAPGTAGVSGQVRSGPAVADLHRTGLEPLHHGFSIAQEHVGVGLEEHGVVGAWGQGWEPGHGLQTRVVQRKALIAGGGGTACCLQDQRVNLAHRAAPT